MRPSFRCSSQHVLKPSSVGRHAGLQSLGDGSDCAGQQSLGHLIPTSRQPLLQLLDGADPVTSVHHSLQFAPHEEVQRVEVRTLRWPGMWLDEGRTGLFQKLGSREFLRFLRFSAFRCRVSLRYVILINFPNDINRRWTLAFRRELS